MQPHYSDDDGPLEDTTADIPLRSKRTERMQRKRATRDRKRQDQMSVVHLPTELILAVLELLRPSDVFNFSLVNRRFRSLVGTNANSLGDEIISRRYGILARCFSLPALLSSVEPSIQPLLTDPRRQQQLSIHKKPYQHVKPPDPQLVCTCYACLMAWNNLNLVLDFAHWQNHLDNGEPVPILPRGKVVQWNDELVDRNARIVRIALKCSLWHARILETHLESTTRSIRRHQKNKGNKRKHVTMTEEEATSGTDKFLDKEGPLGLEFPLNRDDYYMLEAYLPNRWWKKFDRRWVYTSAGGHGHERELEFVLQLSKR